MWLSAVSMKMFGIEPLSSARLPVILAGVLDLCFGASSMVHRERSLMAGLAAAVMALSSQILFIMARHSMTDILLAATGLCAFAILLRDPELQQTRGIAGFVIAAAAGIMAKSIAGILVLAVMGVVVGPGRRRWGRASLAAISAIILASPWFLYNFILHRDWFLADMGFQIVTIAKGAHQSAPDNHFWFYVIRLLNSDLLPLLLALNGPPGAELYARVLGAESTAGSVNRFVCRRLFCRDHGLSLQFRTVSVLVCTIPDSRRCTVFAFTLEGPKGAPDRNRDRSLRLHRKD